MKIFMTTYLNGKEERNLLLQGLSVFPWHYKSRDVRLTSYIQFPRTIKFNLFIWQGNIFLGMQCPVQERGGEKNELNHEFLLSQPSIAFNTRR